MTEDEAEAAAAVDLAWVDLWLSVLRRATTLLLRVGGAKASEDEAIAEEEGKALGPFAKNAFEQLGLLAPSDICVNPGQVQSFEAAREVRRCLLGSSRPGSNTSAIRRMHHFFALHGLLSDIQARRCVCATREAYIRPRRLRHLAL